MSNRQKLKNRLQSKYTQEYFRLKKLLTLPSWLPSDYLDILAKEIADSEDARVLEILRNKLQD